MEDDVLVAENARLLKENERLLKEIAELEAELEILTRFQKKRHRDKGEDY